MTKSSINFSFIKSSLRLAKCMRQTTYPYFLSSSFGFSPNICALSCIIKDNPMPFVSQRCNVAGSNLDVEAISERAYFLAHYQEYHYYILR